MAIQKTVEFLRAEIMSDGTIAATYLIGIDDPDDDELPITKQKTVYIQAHDSTEGQHEWIQRIAEAIWVDVPEKPEPEPVENTPTGA